MANGGTNIILILMNFAPAKITTKFQGDVLLSQISKSSAEGHISVS
jgi:hypothetical protein